MKTSVVLRVIALGLALCAVGVYVASPSVKAVRDKYSLAVGEAIRRGGSQVGEAQRALEYARRTDFSSMYEMQDILSRADPAHGTVSGRDAREKAAAERRKVSQAEERLRSAERRRADMIKQAELEQAHATERVESDRAKYRVGSVCLAAAAATCFFLSFFARPSPPHG